MSNISEKGSRIQVGHVIEIEGLPALITEIEDITGTSFSEAFPHGSRLAKLVPYGASGGYQGKATILEPELAYSIRVEDGPLRLYVWTDFRCDYTAGLAFALAYSEAHARSLIHADYGINLPLNEWGTLQVLQPDAPIAFQVSGGG